MTWLYIIGYLLLGVFVSFLVVKFSPPYVWNTDGDEIGIGLTILVWPPVIVLVLFSALGALIIRVAGRKRK